jgi:hypothetical protein
MKTGFCGGSGISMSSYLAALQPTIKPLAMTYKQRAIFV